MSAIYRHPRRVTYHETDSLGIVYHANYIKYFEEARTSWFRDQGIMPLHVPVGPLTFAVLEMHCIFLKPARFEDCLEVLVEGRLEGARMPFRYAVWHPVQQAYTATGETLLVPLDLELRPTRLPREVRDFMARQKWSETWPPPPEQR